MRKNYINFCHDLTKNDRDVFDLLLNLIESYKKQSIFDFSKKNINKFGLDGIRKNFIIFESMIIQDLKEKTNYKIYAKENIKRKIKLSIGKINFKWTRWNVFENAEAVRSKKLTFSFRLDIPFFEIIKWQRNTNDLLTEVNKMSLNSSSREISNFYKGLLTQKTVVNLRSKTNIKRNKNVEKIKSITNPYEVIINTDASYQSSYKSKRKHETRMAFITIKSRRYNSFTKKNDEYITEFSAISVDLEPRLFNIKIKEFLKDILTDTVRILVVGDLEHSIRTLHEYFENCEAIYCVDRFHYLSYIYKIFLALKIIKKGRQVNLKQATNWFINDLSNF